MNLQADKMEISDFINLSFDKANLEDNSVVLSRFTENTNEEFLDKRADFIKTEIQNYICK